MDWTERRLEVPGLEVAAKIWGPDQGRPVLALHGWLDNAGSFDALIPMLTSGPKPLQLVAIDLPGHGRSPGRGAADAYHFVDWVGVVLQCADALGWERFSILGHSMGAAIASMVAPVAAQRVEGMVFLDGLGPWSHPDDKVVDQLQAGLAEEKLMRDKKRRRYESVEAMLDTLAKSRDDVSRERLRLLLKRGARRDGQGKWYFTYDRKLQAASRLRLTEAQVLTFLSGIECPVFLVRPRWGWPVPEEMMKRRLAAIPDLEVLNVEGGHHVHLEAPQRLCDEVGRFLGAP